MLHRSLTTLALVLCLVAPSPAQNLPRASPESVGMSTERLQRVSAAMKRAVDDGRAPGIVTLVARGGKVIHHESFGHLDRESSTPMTRDAIFRIASMTKAITTVAAVMLMEEGRLLLDDPVSKFIPSFAKTTVLVPAASTGGEPTSAPARRPITIRHLLTHTAGLSYGTGALEGRYKAADVHMWYFADKDEPLAASIDRLATLPFEGQPGDRYIYGFATDVLGVVVEKVSGVSLDEFFRTRIFAPLKMTDSSFFVPADKASRFAVVYSSEQGKLVRAPQPARGQGDYVTGPRKAFSGGAGVVSTASDYARFLQMLLNGGELDGVRLLGPKSVQLMTANHVGNLYQEGRFGFGFGFEVVEHVGRSGRPGSVGEFSWGGAYHTKFWVDPVEEIVAVFMTQILPAPGPALQDSFRNLVNQAITESKEQRYGRHH